MKKLINLLFISLITLSVFGQDSKISDLSSASQPLNDADLFVVVQSATTKKYTFDNLQEDIFEGTDYTLQNGGGGNESIFLGRNVGISYSSGNSNYAFGNACMGALNGANGNNAFGSGSMIYLTSGDYNNAFGEGVMPGITTGLGNCGFGEGVMYNGTVTGDYNFGGGYLSLFSITSGSNNIGIGNEAGYTISTGSNLLAIGYQAGKDATVAGTFIGYAAGTDVSDGANNVALGSQSLFVNTTGAGNTCIGTLAGRNTAGSNNVQLGFNAGYSSNQSGCVMIGKDAGYNNATDNVLYIDNSNTANPLIGGDFTNNRVGIGLAIASIAHALDVAGAGNSTGGWGIDGTMRVDGNGYFIPVSSADASAPNNSIYYSTDAGKLVYKDAGGTPRSLY